MSPDKPLYAQSVSGRQWGATRRHPAPIMTLRIAGWIFVGI